MQKRLEKSKTTPINPGLKLPNEVLSEEKPQLAREMQRELNYKLLEAAKGWNETTLTRLLEKGADANAKNNRGITALMYAAWYDHPESCALLVENGADVNAADTHGQTALMYAAQGGETRTCMVLIEKGADINAKDEDGKTPLMWARAVTGLMHFKRAAFLVIMGHLHGFMAKGLGPFMVSFRECVDA